VLDEKVRSNEVDERKRTRGVESQIIHLNLLVDKKGGPIRKTKDYWNRLFVNLVPPRLIFLFSFFLVFVLFVLEYFTGYSMLFPAYLPWWLALTATYLVVFPLSLPRSFYTWQTLRALALVPVLVFSMLKALLKMKVSRKEFLHTPKTYTNN